MNQPQTDERGEAELRWRVSAPALARFGDCDASTTRSQAADSRLRMDSADQLSCRLCDQEILHLFAASSDISVKTATIDSDNTGGCTHSTTVPVFEGSNSSDGADWRTLPEDDKQRKILQNREHQRRFRVKRKARVQAVQAELAAATAKLQALESQKKATDTQPTVTRQNVVPNSATNVAPLVTQEGSQYGQPYESGPCRSTNIMLTLSVYCPPRVVSLTHLCQLPGPQLFAIWTDYVRELGSCLLHLEACPDKQVGKRMTQLVNECQDLLNGTYEGLHSAMAKAIAGGNLEQAFAATAKLDGSFWHQILDVWQLSLAQVDDILHLRQLVVTRRAVLAEERATIISQLALTSGQMQNSKIEDVRVGRLTEALLRVSAEHRQALGTQTQAWGHGILTLKQTAELVVLTYPHVGFSHAILEVIAKKYGAPSKRDIEAMAIIVSMAQEWQRLEEYCQEVTTKVYPGHLPLVSFRPPFRLPTPYQLSM